MFSSVKGVAFAAPVAIIIIFTHAAFANDDASQAKAVIQTTPASTVHFFDDADRKASAWVAENPDRVAVSIRYGGKTAFTPEQIEQVLEADLIKNDIYNAVFYWEHGNADSGSSVAVETDGYAYGPYGLGSVRKEIPGISAQIQFNRGQDMKQLRKPTLN